jgi:hypothetical protein
MTLYPKPQQHVSKRQANLYSGQILSETGAQWVSSATISHRAGDE